MHDAKSVELAVNTIKTLSIDAVEKAKSGHPGTPMGLANIAFELWAHYLRHDPQDPTWIGRDRFVLSAGHASMLLYSMLHLSGYSLSLDDIKAFRQWGSKTPGHPENFETAGVETTTGPLGQGVGNAVGFALASKMTAARFGMPTEDVRIFCIASDGDLMEGVSGEASSFAGHLALGNLIVIYDDNRITIEGETELAYTEDAGLRYEAYGWHVQRIDGHDHKQIRSAIDAAIAEKTRPSFIVARTHIANGAPTAHDTAESHGSPLGDNEIAATKKAIGWDAERKFFVPEATSELFRERAVELARDKAAWETRFQKWQSANPKLADDFRTFMAKSAPADLYEQLIKALPAKDEATRSHSGALQQVVGELVPSLVGGSADLGPSTKTLLKNSSSITRHEQSGRNLHFGIREHAMGSICNGLSLFGGYIPFASTFLVFSDYMRPAVRLSALMREQCLWIYTHDSILLGEDGPTHQPVEHVWALRLIPNLFVIRPADALESAAAWAIAMARKGGPTAFILSRQKVPSVQRDAQFDPRSVLRGAYIAQEAAGARPDLVIIATGSELQLAIAAKKALELDGRHVRVVSAPCLEQFASEPIEYRNAVLPQGVRRVSIEAGVTGPWRQWVGENGITIGIDRFGASAPDSVLAAKFGFTAEAVIQKIRSAS